MTELTTVAGLLAGLGGIKGSQGVGVDLRNVVTYLAPRLLISSAICLEILAVHENSSPVLYEVYESFQEFFAADAPVGATTLATRASNNVHAQAYLRKQRAAVSTAKNGGHTQVRLKEGERLFHGRRTGQKKGVCVCVRACAR